MTQFIKLISEDGDERMFPRASIKSVATEREPQGHFVRFREPTRENWFLASLADLDSSPAETIVGAAPGWAVAEPRVENGLFDPRFHPVVAWKIRDGEPPHPIHLGPPVASEIVADSQGFVQNFRRNESQRLDLWLIKRQRAEWRKKGFEGLKPDADGVLRIDFAPPGSEPRELAFVEEIITSDDPNFADIARSEIEAMHVRIRAAEGVVAE